MRVSRLILYLPDFAAAIRTAQLARVAGLEKVLTRARSQPLNDGSAQLAEHFGLPAQEFPVAALERLGVTGMQDRDYWWRADPVHLLVDRDQVAMLPRGTLRVSRDEAQALATIFNETYADDGLYLETLQPDVWYLRVPVAWHCRTWDPARVAGWPIAEFMPAGADENPLKKLMNEIQMLFYEQPVNQARERSGQLAINSLWLWGGGTLPEKVGRIPARVISDLPVVRGLTQMAGRECESWPGKLGPLSGGGEVFIAYSVSDFGGDALRMDRELVRPCWNSLLRGGVKSLECFPGGSHVYALTRWQALHFWRRVPAPLAMLEEADVNAAD